jgi:cell division protein FtsL
MGHMVGFYKPFSDIDQELDSCKKKIENLQQKNNFLTKEVQQFSRPSRIIFGDNSNYTMTIN